ncbi:hypothetical protein BH20ACT20_BH20ACT20_05250 [soil metagenome]
MKLVHDGEHLPCGADLGILVDQVAENLPPRDPEHEAGCEHCQAALAELGPLWEQVRELAREDVEVPPALLATVMRAVRAVIPQLVNHALLLGERGTLKIADSVVALIVGREALVTPGVLSLDSGGASSLVGRSPGVVVVVDESRVSVRLRLVVELGWPIPDVVEAVRQRAGAAVQITTGLETAAIDITVTDVEGSDE